MKDSLIVGHRYLISKPYFMTNVNEIVVLEKAINYVKVKYVIANTIAWINYDEFRIIEDLGDTKKEIEVKK